MSRHVKKSKVTALKEDTPIKTYIQRHVKRKNIYTEEKDTHTAAFGTVRVTRKRKLDEKSCGGDERDLETVTEDNNNTEDDNNKEVNACGIKKKKRQKVKMDKKLGNNKTKTLMLDDSDNCNRKSSKFIGAHVSVAGGLYKGIEEADQIKAKAIGLFLRSQRQWNAKPLEEAVVQKFNETCNKYKFPKEMIVPHGSYLLNIGSPVAETREKSVCLLVDELQRCDRLGIPLYNFHPGSTCKKISKTACIEMIAAGINHAHKNTSKVVTVIENMSGQGGTIGGRFEELHEIITRVEDKSRVGVCLDTCHMFAAGYDISTREGYEAMKTEFDEVVGFSYLKAFHLNDSKGKVGCHLDRHEDIGRGHIGLEPFRWFVNDPQFDHIPMVLETPGHERYDKAISELYSLIL